MKKKVLIIAGFYLPSVKGGGPIQSIKNLVDNLSNKIDFYIVAADRDLGDNKPFENIIVDEWTSIGNANVIYTDITRLTWDQITQIINEYDYDVLYLNSFFDYKLSIVPILLRKLKRIKVKKIVLAPRGQFSSGALGLKNKKKKLFIKMTKIMGLYKGITWHATAQTEKKDIECIFGADLKLTVANNLTENYEELRFEKKIKKIEGELKIVFISRIHPKKNLKEAIRFLKTIKGNVEFNIYGPKEDKLYWSECETVISELPSNIKVNYQGILTHDEIMSVFKMHHVFLFPTLGENFGHVISEALIGGCPVIISNRTPWIGLEQKQVGWDIDLSAKNSFLKSIQYCVDLNSEEYNQLAKNAFLYGKKKSNRIEDLENFLVLFE